ncbi:gag-pol polyprotein [Cucumis melo var. makuwa]|uniref:Gag-pol polyprotein n=1 Tax=Cucumis melo var. makuwa TaxID=1194695 RepID=A0A5D3CBH3_CUCMM|nr:gag-pol polyprotein [Cucumis melo var. makuwa]
MTEDETVSEYNGRVLEIVNDSLLLGEKILESKIVRKVLRSLPRKFDMKVTTKEEAQDITTLKLDELFWSLLTFEMAMSDRESKKGKGIAFISVYDQENTVNQFEADSEHSNIGEDEELTLKELKMLRKEDSEARAVQKERIQDLMDKNERLMGIISSLKVKLKEVQNVCDQTIKFVKMLNSITDNLDSILSLGQNGSSKYCLGFDTSTRGVKITPEVKFVPASVKETTDPSCKKLSTNTGAKFSRWVCYYCGRRGHIRSFCYKLLRDRRHQQRPKLVNKQNQYRTTKRNNDVRGTHLIWRVKTFEKCNVAFTTVQTHVDAWYFDSGCSRHMTGNRSFFIELEECASGHVTFGDGAKRKIIAKGNIDKSNLPCLNEVLYVDGLKANLISLWHRKLGHISFRSLDKVIRNEAVVGIPSLDINEKFFCGYCPVGKQTKTSLRRLKKCYTIRVLELLHLDLMGPMQTESLRGKKYVLVVVDDYSIFTWVRFLKGKLDTIKLCISLCLNLQCEKGQKIIRIRTDHVKEFDNEDLNNFCQTEGIHHEFVASITP